MNLRIQGCGRTKVLHIVRYHNISVREWDAIIITVNSTHEEKYLLIDLFGNINALIKTMLTMMARMGQYPIDTSSIIVGRTAYLKCFQI